MAEFGVNLIGKFDVANSISHAAVNLALALRSHGVPVTLYSPALGETGGPGPLLDLPPELSRLRAHSAAQCVHPVNLYICPLAYLDQAAYSMLDTARGRLHVANVWWEFTELPETYRRSIQRHDAVLANSGFIANVVRTSAPGVHVMDAPLPWPVDPGRPDRARFGLDADATVFTFVFDARSDPARKNPDAVVSAFKAAFPSTADNVQLVIRPSNLDSLPGADPSRLRAALPRHDARIRILDGPLDYRGVLSLYASSDVYVSLHRAEGLGLGILESMAHGKPVIATAWSGSMSFTDVSCAALVRTRRVASPGPEYRYHGIELPADARWGEPLLEDAAAWMRRLHQDAALRSRLGVAARRRYERHQREAMASGWVDQLRMLHEARAWTPQIRGRLSSARLLKESPA